MCINSIDLLVRLIAQFVELAVQSRHMTDNESLEVVDAAVDMVIDDFNELSE